MAAGWRYLLIMKSLPSEYRALVQLTPEIARSVTPLIQLWDRTPSPDVGEDLDGEGDLAEGARFFGEDGLWAHDPGQKVWERLQRGLLARIKGLWPDEQPIVLDGGWLEREAAFASVLDNCRAFGRRAVPVTGLGRPDAYQQVVAGSMATDRGGFVLRLSRSDFGAEGTSLQRRIEILMELLGGTVDTTDLVLDLRCVEPQYRERDELFAESMIRSLPYLGRWRNLTLAASSMPKDGAGFTRNEITPFQRVEWWIWHELRSRAALLGRLPGFGDYGVIHPDRVETVTDPKSLPRIPQIRYAVRDRSLMIRGLDLRQEDRTHLERLLQLLIDSGADWSGPAFSAGDAWIERTAQGTDGPGNWGTWKWAGQVHHVTHLSQQLATMPDA